MPVQNWSHRLSELVTSPKSKAVANRVFNDFPLENCIASSKYHAYSSSCCSNLEAIHAALNVGYTTICTVRHDRYDFAPRTTVNNIRR